MHHLGLCGAGELTMLRRPRGDDRGIATTWHAFARKRRLGVHSTSAQHSHASMCASHLAACRPQLGEHRRPSSNCWNVSLAIKRGDGKCSMCELRHGGVKQHLFTVVTARQKAKTTQRRKRKSEERETAQHAASRTGHVRSSASATWQSMVRVVHIHLHATYTIVLSIHSTSISGTCAINDKATALSGHAHETLS